MMGGAAPSRLADVLELIEWRRPLDELVVVLANYPWDYEGPTVKLCVGHVRGALTKYLEGRVTAKNVEDWADAIELRDDIDYEREHEEVLAEVMHELANPVLTETLTPERARQLHKLLDI